MSRKWTFEFYPNPLSWLWRTLRFDHCTIYHRGPVTVKVYK